MIRIDLKNLIAGGRLNLTNAQIKKVAEQMLVDYSPAVLESPQAVDIDGFITDYLGFKLRYACLTNNMSILGATTFSDDKFIFFDPATKGIKKDIAAKNMEKGDTHERKKGDYYIFNSACFLVDELQSLLLSGRRRFIY